MRRDGTTLILLLLFMSNLLGYDTQPVPKVSVKRVVVESCARNMLHLGLRLELQNKSASPIVLGSIAALQQRLFSTNAQNNLDVIRTSPVPDEFDSHDVVSNEFPEIVENPLDAGKKQSVGLKVHVLYFPTDVQSARNRRHLIVGFHISNLRRNGKASDFWTDPVRVLIPENCKGSLQ